MAVPQITIRLSPELKANFERYAGRLGLRSSELTKLLIVREREQRQLEKLKQKPLRERRQQNDGPLPTITAHVSSIEEVEEFDSYAHRCGFNRNGAGAWLLEKEMRDRWLETAIKQPAKP
ncbi:MAG TPA: hypothetical protein VH020_07310 [Stellaceae bacterium]|nr:hypothetical protein [Stellaceae bacterium]